MERLFIALNLPKEVKEKIGKTFYKKLPEQKLKSVSLDKVHITLCFLGEVSEDERKDMEQKLKTLAQKTKSFEIQLKGIGEFNQRVLWLGITQGKKETELLAREIAEKLNKSREKFTGHLTIARNKTLGAKKFKLLVETLKKISFEAKFKVTSFELMESQLQRTGAIYSELKKFELKQT